MSTLWNADHCDLFFFLSYSKQKVGDGKFVVNLGHNDPDHKCPSFNLVWTFGPFYLILNT